MENKKEIEQKTTEDENKSLKKKKGFCRSKNFSLGFAFGFFVMGIIATVLVYVFLTPPIKKSDSAFNLETIKTKTGNFINNVLIGDKGNKITVKESSEESGLYKVVVTTSSGKDIGTYMTKDGKLFFDNVIDVEKAEKAKKDAIKKASQEKKVVKSDKPKVQLFVMSYCPYGTQTEKGILPVVKTLGDKIDFGIKFVDYSMHGDKELNENLRQYCIKTEEPTKFNSYLGCFLKAGDSKSCVKEEKISTTKLNSCISATDKKYKVTANSKNKSTYKGNYPTFNIYKQDNDKYNVAGSPTLVINGTTVSPKRDSASLLDAICSGFNNPPKECFTKLSSDAPSAGFGYSVSKSGDESSASCN